jgi:hypothetical protein
MNVMGPFLFYYKFSCMHVSTNIILGKPKSKGNGSRTQFHTELKTLCEESELIFLK